MSIWVAPIVVPQEKEEYAMIMGNVRAISDAGISVSEVAERVKEMGDTMRRTDTITTGKYVTPEEAYMLGLDIPEPKEKAQGVVGMSNWATTNNNELGMLWDSTAEFHKRFETIDDQEHPFIPAQYRAFMEEVAEFSIEVLRANADDPANLERELADVIVVGMGLLMAHGRTLADLRAAMREIATKNDAKTHDTHAKNTKGKVARKTA